MNRQTLLLGALLLALVAGCARQPLQPVDSWSEHKAAAEQIGHWQMNGKLGARLPDNNGSARLRWQQEQEDFHINLSGPFGQGRVIIETFDEGVRLRQGGDPPLEAASAEELMWQATGWALPVEHLVYWVRGIPAPEAPYHIAEHTEEGFMKSLTQNGWQLDYSDYRATDAVPLPGRIVASRDDIRLTLVIYRWTL